MASAGSKIEPGSVSASICGISSTLAAGASAGAVLSPGLNSCSIIERKSSKSALASSGTTFARGASTIFPVSGTWSLIRSGASSSIANGFTPWVSGTPSICDSGRIWTAGASIATGFTSGAWFSPTRSGIARSSWPPSSNAAALFAALWPLFSLANSTRVMCRATVSGSSIPARRSSTSVLACFLIHSFGS